MKENKIMFKKVERPQSLSIRTYSKDMVLKFKKPKLKSKPKIESTRGNINRFSFRSQRRLRLFARNTSHLWKIFIHLTYPKDFPSEGKEVKRHLDVFIKRLKRRYPNIKYLWVIEFQKRGAPHYHIVTDKEINKDWLSENWYEVVDSKDIKHLYAGTKVEPIRDKDRTASYMTDYLDKIEQKIVPEEYKNIGRFWSHSANTLESKEYIINDLERSNKRKTRTLRRWYKAKMRSWGYKWKWKGEGFIVWEGASFLNEFKKRGLPLDLIK